MQTTVTVNWNKGVLSERHNQRDEELCKHENHIDLENKHGQSSHEVWYRSDLKEKYEEVFGDAIEEYNSKQKRKDRRLDVDKYMESIKNDTRGKSQTKLVNGKRVVDETARKGKQLSYEITVKVGNTERERDALGRVAYDNNGHHIRKQELPRELQRDILQEYCNTFQDENPNFRVVNIDFHADEGFYNRNGVWEYSTCHPHIEFIPVASGFKQGLSTQNSMNKAMKEMGFDDNQCYEKWAKKEQQRLESITHEAYSEYCQRHPDFHKNKGSLEIIHPVAERRKVGGKSKEQYAAEQELNEIIYEKKIYNSLAKKRSEEQLETNEQLNNDLKAKLDDLSKQQIKLQQQQDEVLKTKNTALQAISNCKSKEQELQEKIQEVKLKEVATDTERRAYKDAKEVYENLIVNQPVNKSFEGWAKTKTYIVPKTKTTKQLKRDMSGYEYKTAYVKGPDGKVIRDERTPWDDYQLYLQSQERTKKISQREQIIIDKADDYDYGYGD